MTDDHHNPLQAFHEPPVACAWLRFVAWILDTVVLVVVTIPLNPALYGTDMRGAVVAMSGATLVVAFVYLVLSDASNGGATLGKRIVGLRVIRSDGTNVGFTVAFVRRVMYVLGGYRSGSGGDAGAAVAARRLCRIVQMNSGRTNSSLCVAQP